ncbi:MAG: hypothetical protein ACRDRL_13595, partial [Sciscionella sp.]
AYEGSNPSAATLDKHPRDLHRQGAGVFSSCAAAPPPSERRAGQTPREVIRAARNATQLDGLVRSHPDQAMARQLDLTDLAAVPATVDRARPPVAPVLTVTDCLLPCPPISRSAVLPPAELDRLPGVLDLLGNPLHPPLRPRALRGSTVAEDRVVVPLGRIPLNVPANLFRARIRIEDVPRGGLGHRCGQLLGPAL